MKKKMRPPLTTTKNEGVQPPSTLQQRKIQITQKEALSENQSSNNYHKTNSLNLSSEPSITFEICNEINNTTSGGNNKTKVKFDNSPSDANSEYFIQQHQNDPIRARINKNLNPIVDQSFNLSDTQPNSNIFVNTFEEDHHLYSSVHFPSIDRNPIIHNSYNNRNCISPSLATLPLSETEPLLTNIEATVTDPERSICLNKNSASLIFTKKDLANIHIPNGSNNIKSINVPSTYENHKRHHSQKAESSQRISTTSENSESAQLRVHHRRSLQLNYLLPGGSSVDCEDNTSSTSISGNNHYYYNQNVGHRTNTTAANTRKQHAYSWYAPVYTALEEELEQDSRDSSPIHNLANIRKTTEKPLTDNETVSLLETKNNINIQPQLSLHQSANRKRRSCSVAPSLTLQTISPSQLSVTPTPQQPSILLTPTLGVSTISPTTNQSSQQQLQIKQQIKQKQQQHQQLTQQQQQQNDNEGPHATSLLAGGPLPRRRRFENFLKSLVGRKPSKDSTANPPLLPSPDITITRTPSNNNVLHDPNGVGGIGLGVVCSGRGSIISNGSYNISDKLAAGNGGSTTSLNTIQQKLWNVVPLLRRENSATSLNNEKSQSIVQYTTGLRKCETVLALTRQTSASCSNNGINNGIGINNISGVAGVGVGGSGNGGGGVGGSMSNGVEQIRPLNRLRNSLSTSNATCSRCSSLLSLAASGSRYSLNIANSGFVNVNNNNKNINFSASNNYVNNISHSIVPNNHNIGNNSVSRKSSSSANSNNSGNQNIPSSNDTTATLHSSSSPSASVSSSPIFLSPTLAPETMIATTITPTTTPILEIFTCKLCLADVSSSESTTISQCGCNFCTECMKAYVDFEISEGAYEISCPDAQCPAQGIIMIAEIANLTSTNLMKKYHRYRLNREIELDKTRTWCPRAGCETVCSINGCGASSSSAAAAANALASGDIILTSPLCSVQCPTCNEEFCSGCKKPWHPSITCDDNNRRLVADGQDDIGIPFDNDLIKCCPMCAVPIEKDEGCAQMMCKRCKHVFCWYCLASLDDDFLLRHYDKGPCKNKLGHSRASVVWHRAQVIGIFAGFGILLLVASPLLLLAAPCIICCKCRVCSGSGKMDDPEGDFDEAVALQR